MTLRKAGDESMSPCCKCGGIGGIHYFPCIPLNSHVNALKFSVIGNPETEKSRGENL
jgi:hypothetical protein